MPRSSNVVLRAYDGARCTAVGDRDECRGTSTHRDGDQGKDPLGATGWFESSGQAAAPSKAAVFKPGRLPVAGYFALAGGMPFQMDAPATVRSMALCFLTPDARFGAQPSPGLSTGRSRRE